MNKYLLSFFLSFSITAFAQNVDTSIYEYSIKGPFRSFEDPVSQTREILKLAEVIAKQNGIFVQKEILKNPRNNTQYEVLRVLAQGSSVANREAARVEKEFEGLKLILSPYDLKRSGSEAFFNPDGSSIGVPSDFIYNRLSEAYWHEIKHAITFQKIIKGREDQYAGLMTVKNGTYLSQSNLASYFRFSSIDEFRATLFSASFDMHNLYENFKNSKGKDFYNESNESLLTKVYNSLNAGKGLCGQIKDVSLRSIESLNKANYTVAKSTLKLGSRGKRDIYHFVIKIDSYERELMPGGGRTYLKAIENGAEIHLYSLTSDIDQIVRRLDKLAREGDDFKREVELILRSIPVRIEFPDLARTQIDSLAQQFSGKFSFH